ncbi:hypothetical protein [Streptomyces sp. NPDC058674]|uniref:hypothetical protein n=1 Tax=Streptomyces sp. NPDC058674 TaxID=3346592 RepID=UPI003663885C
MSMPVPISVRGPLAPVPAPAAFAGTSGTSTSGTSGTSGAFAAGMPSALGWSVGSGPAFGSRPVLPPAPGDAGEAGPVGPAHGTAAVARRRRA